MARVGTTLSMFYIDLKMVESRNVLFDEHSRNTHKGPILFLQLFLVAWFLPASAFKLSETLFIQIEGN